MDAELARRGPCGSVPRWPASVTAPLVVVGDVLLDVDLVGTVGAAVAGRAGAGAGRSGRAPAARAVPRWPRCWPPAWPAGDRWCWSRRWPTTTPAGRAAPAAGRPARADRVPLGRQHPGQDPAAGRPTTRWPGWTAAATRSAIGPLPAAGTGGAGSAAAVLVADYGRGATGDPAVRAALAGRALRRSSGIRTRAARRAGARRTPEWPRPNLRRARRRLRSASDARRGPHRRRHRERGRRSGWPGSWQRRGSVCVTLGRRGALFCTGRQRPAPGRAGPRSAPATPAAPGTASPPPRRPRLADGALPSEAVEHGGAAAGRFVAARRGGRPRCVGGRRPADGPTAGRAGRRLVALLDRVRAPAARWSPPAAASTCCTPATSPPCRPPGPVGDCLVVCLNSDASVRRLKGAAAGRCSRAADRARVLAALRLRRRRGRLRRGHPGRGAAPDPARHLGQGRRLLRRGAAGGGGAGRVGRRGGHGALPGRPLDHRAGGAGPAGRAPAPRGDGAPGRAGAARARAGRLRHRPAGAGAAAGGAARAPAGAGRPGGVRAAGAADARRIDSCCRPRELAPLRRVPAGRWTSAIDLHGNGPASRRLLAALRPRPAVRLRRSRPALAGPRWRAGEHEVAAGGAGWSARRCRRPGGWRGRDSRPAVAGRLAVTACGASADRAER